MTRPARIRQAPSIIITGAGGMGGVSIPPPPVDSVALDDLSDVDTTGVADGDAILYDSGSSTWLPGTSTPTEILDIPTAETDTTLVLAPDGAGGVEWVTPPTGSGGGVYAQADEVPGSPSAYDDEFATLSGWTTLGTLDSGTPEVTTRPGHLYLRRTTAVTDEIDGIYRAAPSVPFTVTCKVAEMFPYVPSEHHIAGLLLTEASPGKCFTFGLISNSGYSYWNDAVTAQWTNRTTRSTTVDHNILYALQFPWKYQRLVVTSTTAEVWISADGFIWENIIAPTAHGLTVANAGLYVGAASGTANVHAMFDWIRFT